MATKAHHFQIHMDSIWREQFLVLTSAIPSIDQMIKNLILEQKRNQKLLSPSTFDSSPPSFIFFVSTYRACAAGHYVISEIFDGWVGWADSEAGGKHPSTVETRLPTFVVRNDICKEVTAV